MIIMIHICEDQDIIHVRGNKFFFTVSIALRSNSLLLHIDSLHISINDSIHRIEFVNIFDNIDQSRSGFPF